MDVSFHYLPVASSLLSSEDSRRTVGEYAAGLGGIGGSEVGPESIGTSRRLVYLVLTGGTERRILDLENDRTNSVPDEPVVLVAYPGRNSLPAALEVLARLQQDGADGRIVFLDGADDANGLSRLAAAVSGESGKSPATGRNRTLNPDRLLHGKKIGLIGEPSDWLVASSPPHELVKGTWGAEVVTIAMAELYGRVAAADRALVEGFAATFRDGASDVREPMGADLEASAAVYAALRSLVDDLCLDAVTVRCFDLVTERGATGCLALSRLADDGIVAACEGDLVSALAMLWLRDRLGQPSWMANPSRVDVASSTLWLAHCTVPRCMVSDYALRSHFESGLGAAIQGSLPKGPVTLLRIGGKRLDRVWVTEGEITARGTNETMCRTQVEARLRGSAPGAGSDASTPSVADLLEEPLGNHLVLVRGAVAGDLIAGHGGLSG